MNNTLLENEDISGRAKEGLRKAGYVTIGDLKTLKESEVLLIPTLTMRSRREVVNLLKRKGLLT